MSILLVDLGSSRLKWATLDNSSLQVAEPILCRDESLSSILDDVWNFSSCPEIVFVSCVAKKTSCQQLDDWIKSHWHYSARFVESQAQTGSLKNAYPEAEKLGSDRWLAMLESWERVQHAVCVVDCGTAVTIDVVDGTGRHIGGFIMPGLTTMLSALSASTRLILHENEIPGKFRLGHTTQDAITGGVSLAIVSLVLRTVSHMKSCGEQEITCFITGGDAEKLAPLLDCEYILDRDLVLKGLARVATGN